jgi:hypothetical protein
MINLMSNAGRFTEKGGVSVKVWIADEQFYFSVRDTGPGISPADQERLFEPFQQLDDSIRRKQGGASGWRSVALCRNARGMMWLESAFSEGTTFTSVCRFVMGIQGNRGASRWVNPIAAIDAGRGLFGLGGDLVPALRGAGKKGIGEAICFDAYWLGGDHIVVAWGQPSIPR